jgi:hypothetical protein
MHSWRRCLLVCSVLGLAVACGGTVIAPDDETDGGEGGSGGSAGSGGGVAGSGGGVAGSGGGVAGSGGGVAGSGGGVAGSGGAPACPPMPSCNWCGGETVFDSNGCFVQYVCDNGVDPCSTQPCWGPEDCGVDEKCFDELCWSAGPLSCEPAGCGGYVDPSGYSTCSCDWSCTDGNKYGFDCTSMPGGGISCECRKNGVNDTACGTGGVGGGPMVDPCSADCCGFPQ